MTEETPSLEAVAAEKHSIASAGDLLEEASDRSGSGGSPSRGELTEGNVMSVGKGRPIQIDKIVLERAESRRPALPMGDDLDEVYQHLPPHQADVLRRQVFTPELQKGVKIVYRYSSRIDIMIIIISAICAIASGAAGPLMTVIFGNLQHTLRNYLYSNGAETNDEFINEMSKLVLYFVYLAIGQFIVTYVCTVGFSYTGEHISAKIRERYLESCMRQNIGFFDKIGAGEVTTCITLNTNLIQDGISHKVSLALSAFGTFFAASIVGFVTYWKLTLILSCAVCAMLLVVGIGSKLMLNHGKASLESYVQGGNVADEAISSIRNTIAFGAQDRLAMQYDIHLKKAEYYGIRAKGSMAIMVAGMWLIFYLNYGLAFWQGSKFLVEGDIPLSKLLIIMMSVIMGALSLGSVLPNIQAFTTAIAAAAKIFNTIDRISPLDPLRDDGEKLDHLEGNIRLENIKHIYPSRPEVVVIEDLSLNIPAGKTTALVGTSGSGKSTVVGLVERFYNPVEGTIYFDGHDISKLNLKWLRQQMALVSQEPTLFGTTIYDNILYGLIGTKFEDETSERQRELVIEAAKKANAHGFVSDLPEGYETNVGAKGFLLSGGQKQRIAIARAIVSDPKILLLDEATSALDTKCEGVVQTALEAAAAGRTTITIAHRLSTIKDAHNIVVMSQGRIIEQGTHDELLEKKTAYFNLVSAQNIAAAEDLTAEEEAELTQEETQLHEKMSTSEEGGCIANADRITAKLARAPVQKLTSSVALQNQKLGEEGQKYRIFTLISLIASFNKPEWRLMLAGLFFSVICGSGYPILAVFYAKQIATLSQPITNINRYQVKKDSDFWSLMFLMLAFVQFIALFLQGIAFAVCSERLIRRTRNRAFRAMLRQDIAFFDKDENTVGALTSILSTETNHVAGLSGITLGTLLMMMSTLVSVIVLSLAIGWKLSLVCMSTIPILLGCGFFRLWVLTHFQRRAKAAYVSSASFASEAISSIRTVASLTREHGILTQYRNSLAAQQRRSLMSVFKSSALYAASQSLLFLCLALGFWYGGTLIGNEEYNLFQFFLCLMAVIFGTQSVGSIFSFAPDMSKAHQATEELKTLFDRKPTIDSWSKEGEQLQKVDGIVEFRDVHFRYPTRPEQPVLRGLSFLVRPGQYVALVGPSGCGKSTAIALLERFYDPLAGGVYVDGKKIDSLNINNYRSFISLVSQEPTLYQGTIKQNITLGSVNEEVSDEIIEFACREANIRDFVLSLPEGFNTVVGSKGTLLSGGQRQRIAIARALIRNPMILLLDEATSALDSESELVVQAALDRAARGRTTIAVAHRLSTIQKADSIYVFDQGRIVEAGTHADLMKKNGRYAELVNLQSLAKHG